MTDILILVMALSMDTFVASIAYGAGQMNIKWKEVFLINGICSGCLGLALCFGTIIDSFVPETLTKAICCISLLILGLWKLCDYWIKRCIRKHCKMEKSLHFSISQLKFIINIYGNPMEADEDASKSLSAKEAVFLAFAMSIDSLVAGTLAAFLKIHTGLTIFTAFLMGTLVMYAGLFIGRKLSSRKEVDLSWLGGALFIFLAVTKMLP